MLIRSSIGTGPKPGHFGLRLQRETFPHVPPIVRFYIMVTVFVAALSGLLYLFDPDQISRLFSGNNLFLFVGAVSAIGMFAAARAAVSELRRIQHLSADLRMVVEPGLLAEAPGYDRSGNYSPSPVDAAASGEFYDFFSVGSGKYGVLIGDVMNGENAASSTSVMLRYSARALCVAGLQPAQIIAHLNEMIDLQTSPSISVALFVGILDSHTHNLLYANAGHEAPMMLSSEWVESRLAPTGLALAAGHKAYCDERTVTLSGGDYLLLVTDGVTEAQDEEGYFLKEDTVWQLFRKAVQSPTAARSLEVVKRGVEEFVGTGQRQNFAMLLLRGVAADQTV